jgi:RNA polymerase sigma factor (sigma-70 family)
MHASQVIGWMSGLHVVGMDIAKSVFQLYTVDMKTGELRDKRLKRDKVLEFFRLMAPAMVAMEACGGAHHWARQLQKLGHQVRLVHARAVRPFVQGNKTDVTDARAIWLAVQQSGMRFVAVKTEAQQAALTLHRQRQQYQQLVQALRDLPARQREAFTLRVLQDLDGATTARAMGCSEGAVKTHLARARQALQNQLEMHP